jgi:anthranilate phosphoribosyltransferase
MDINQILNKLVQKKNLASREVEFFLGEIIKGNATPAQIAAFLVSLNMKGETTKEIIGLVKTMRKHMTRVQLPDAIDVCGTGGDGKGTFNISTAVAFVVAGAGIRVAKHGNRAASSQCGSADVLEALGVHIQLSSRQIECVFKKVGMIFLFAPLYHPAMKQVTMVRKELKIRTIFNVLGPFVNPASVTKQLIGVPNIEIASKLSEVAKKMKYKHLCLVTSEDGMDEIGLSSKSFVFDIRNHSVKKIILNPAEYGFSKARYKDLAGGSAVENAKIIRNILSGSKNTQRNIVVLNSACAFYAADTVKTIKEGIKLARESIDSGNALSVLERLKTETHTYA